MDNNRSSSKIPHQLVANFYQIYQRTSARCQSRFKEDLCWNHAGIWLFMIQPWSIVLVILPKPPSFMQIDKDFDFAPLVRCHVSAVNSELLKTCRNGLKKIWGAVQPYAKENDKVKMTSILHTNMLEKAKEKNQFVSPYKLCSKQLWFSVFFDGINTKRLFHASLNALTVTWWLQRFQKHRSNYRLIRICLSDYRWLKKSRD